MSLRRRRVCWHRNSVVPDCVCTRDVQHRKIILSVLRVCDAGTAPVWEAEASVPCPGSTRLEMTLHSVLSWLFQGMRGGLSPRACWAWRLTSKQIKPDRFTVSEL